MIIIKFVLLPFIGLFRPELMSREGERPGRALAIDAEGTSRGAPELSFFEKYTKIFWVSLKTYLLVIFDSP